MGTIRIGLSSWTDKSLPESGKLYPPEASDAEGRYDQKKLDDELDRVHTERSSLESRPKEVERCLQAETEIADRKRSIQECCRRVIKKIDAFDFEQKRLALDALNVKVLIDGKRVAVSGAIPTHFVVRTPSLPHGAQRPQHRSRS